MQVLDAESVNADALAKLRAKLAERRTDGRGGGRYAAALRDDDVA